MQGFAEILIETCGDSEQGRTKEFLERISTAAARMDRLIADALNYSRSVRQELPLEDVDAEALLRGMLDSYPELQPEKAHIRVEGRLPTVLANQAGLTQCFSNLLGNAVKFVRPGELPRIRVWASDRDGWVRIWVEDNGIGISREMLPRVFDMFSRASKAYEGTGIGLALVRKVVQRMGGRVGVESEEGKGSRFWIELKGGEAKARGVQAPAFSAARGGGEGTVLYVEDEEGDAHFMKQAFRRNGLAERIRLVRDGRAAIDYLSGAREYSDRETYPVPALVLLDLNLPQVPGFQVLKWIRNHPDYARTPVVVFTSSTREDDRVKARELGAHDFIAKPSSWLGFVQVVETLKATWLAQTPNGAP
jgi:CheY-like chemotaxis protein